MKNNLFYFVCMSLLLSVSFANITENVSLENSESLFLLRKAKEITVEDQKQIETFLKKKDVKDEAKKKKIEKIKEKAKEEALKKVLR